MLELGIMVACADAAAVRTFLRHMETIYGRRVRVVDWYRDREGDTILEVAILAIADTCEVVSFPRRH